MISRQVCLFIDTLRQKKNLSMLKFTDGIVSLRQYKRYLYGDSEMPHKVFILLCDRLNFDTINVIAEMQKEKLKQHDDLDKFYNYVIHKRYREVDTFIKEFDTVDFLSNELNIYYETTKLLYTFFQNPSSRLYCAEKCSKLINYPKILTHEVFNSIEILGLGTMMNFVKDEDKNLIKNKLSDLILNRDYLLGKDLYSTIYIIVKVAKEYGLEKDNQQVIYLCEKGLQILQDHYSYYNGDLLHYSLALSYRNLGVVEKSHYHLQKLRSYLSYVDVSQAKYDNYVRMIEKDFNLSLNDLPK